MKNGNEILVSLVGSKQNCFSNVSVLQSSLDLSPCFYMSNIFTKVIMESKDHK
jgi:hypothetical protein